MITPINIWLVILFAAAVLLTAIWLKQSWPVITAAICLALLALLFVDAREKIIGACTVPESAQGEIVEYPIIEAERVQYVVEVQDTCQVLVSGARFPLYQVGDQVQLTGGKIRLVSEFGEEFRSYAKYLQRRGITATWAYPGIVVVGRKASINILSATRGELSARVHKLWREPNTSVIAAMLLAESGTIPAEMLEHFRLTGTSHILSISGLHVSLIAAMLWFTMSVLPWPPSVRTVVIITILWFYILMIGAPISAVRAGLFWSFTLIAMRLRLLVSLPTVLLLAVTGLITFRPSAIFDISFQLSVGAVLGIWLALFLTRPWRKGIEKFFLSGALVSFGASITTWPLVAYHFKLVSLISLLVNPLVVPAFGIVLALAILALILSALSFPLALLVALVVEELLFGLEKITKIFAQVPYTVFIDVNIGLTAAGLYYGALILLAMWLVRRQGRSWREVWE